MIFLKLDFKRNLTLRDKYAVTKISLKAKFDCIYIMHIIPGLRGGVCNPSFWDGGI